MTDEITALADANRDLISAGYRSARETLLALGEPADGYSPDGSALVGDRPVTAWSTGACDMSGTFSSLNTALTALRYQQVALDIASTNIANVVDRRLRPPPRRRARRSGRRRCRRCGPATRAPATASGRPASTGWSTRSSTPGPGASTAPSPTSTPARRPSSASRPGIGEPGDNGVAAALADFRQGWHDLANNPGSDAARSQVLARADTLADAIRIQSRNVASEEGDQRVRLLADVAEINTVAGGPGRDQPTSIAVAHASAAPTPPPCSTSATSWRCGCPS